MVPLGRLDSVLIIANQPRYKEQAKRVFNLLERARHYTERRWHVCYLRNSHADDMAYLLQLGFTPQHVTAQPTSAGQASRAGTSQFSGSGFSRGGAAGGSGAGGIGSSSIGGSSSSSTGGGLITGAGAAGGAGGAPAPAVASASSSNPLLGGLGTGRGDTNADQNAMRIILNRQNNAVLVYATPQEAGSVKGTLRKVDILPLQVRIDAVIAEVTLNDALQFGTQFLSKSSGLATAFSGVSSGRISARLFSGKGISETLQALRAVTTVDVLSSPDLLVLDNETAHLQTGALVPYLSQSTLTSTSNVVKSVQYQQTGVIIDVTPRVNSGGLMMMDISQEVSDVSTAVTTTGLNSPTFNERRVISRVVVQDGQTVGLAGLIEDSGQESNSGVPWLKNMPILGFLAGQQDNQRDGHADRGSARPVAGCGLVPDLFKHMPLAGSRDPSEQVRQRLNLGP